MKQGPDGETYKRGRRRLDPDAWAESAAAVERAAEQKRLRELIEAALDLTEQRMPGDTRWIAAWLELSALPAPERQEAALALSQRYPSLAAMLQELSAENFDHFSAVLTQILRERDPSLSYSVEVEGLEGDTESSPREIGRPPSAKKD